jgi:hypothetical protein
MSHQKNISKALKKARESTFAYYDDVSLTKRHKLWHVLDEKAAHDVAAYIEEVLNEQKATQAAAAQVTCKRCIFWDADGRCNNKYFNFQVNAESNEKNKTSGKFGCKHGLYKNRRKVS